MSSVSMVMTVDLFFDYAAMHDRSELIEGEVRQKSLSSAERGRIAARLLTFLHHHVMEHDLGEVYAAETGFILDAKEHTVRAPDVAYIHKRRAAEANTAKFVPISPDLCAEVLSPDDRVSEVKRKIQAWLDFGTRVVWEVDPQTRSVTVHDRTGLSRLLREVDVLSGGDVLPGFALQLAELFKVR